MQANHHWRRNDSLQAQIAHLRIMADTCMSRRTAETLQSKLEALRAKLALETLRKLRAARAVQG